MKYLPKVFLFFSAAFSFVLFGCNGVTLNDSWKDTKKFYHKHIERPEVLDVSNQYALEAEDQSLVQHSQQIDVELTRLEKHLDALSERPDPQKLGSLFQEFPWLTGLTVVSPSGEVEASIPEHLMKELDFSPLLPTPPKKLPRELRTSIQNSPLGPEMLIARPFLQSAELQHLLVASFDFRALLPYVKSPADLVVRCPEYILWSGEINYESSPMATVDWKEYIRSRTDGELENDNMKMVWFSRYFGNIPLIFATLKK